MLWLFMKKMSVILMYGRGNLQERKYVSAFMNVFSSDFRMLTYLQYNVDRLNADNADLHDELKKVQTNWSQVLLLMN